MNRSRVIERYLGAVHGIPSIAIWAGPVMARTHGQTQLDVMASYPYPGHCAAFELVGDSR